MTEQLPLRVVIADDHPVFRDGLAGLIGAMNGIEVVGTAGNGSEAVEIALRLEPDVVIMDLHMPDVGGAEATARILEKRPEISVLVLTMLDDDGSLFAALEAGARGYLLKEATPDEIGRAVRTVAGGAALLHPTVAERVLGSLAGKGHRAATPPPFPHLTPKERDILELVARGLSNPAIAERMFLSEKTVRNYVSTIFSKIHVNDRAGAVAAARDAGMGQA